MTTIVAFIVGAFIGWNFPQPDFAKAIQAKIVDFFKKK